MTDLSQYLQESCHQGGLIYLGFVDLRVDQAFVHYQRWLSEGRHGAMTYLENHQEIRGDPQKVLPHAQSAIIVGLGYQLSASSMPSSPRIAGYAQGNDYHKDFWRRGAQLVARWKADRPEFSQHHFRVCSDSAPVLERALAAKLPQAFIGKNTMLIHRRWGGALLLSEIFTTMPLADFIDGDQQGDINPLEDPPRCGTCRRCQVHCPTGALDEDYRIDARRCLSYWTIEHRGAVPVEYWPYFAEYYYGCDRCQTVCPFNRRAETSPQTLKSRDLNYPLAQIVMMSQRDYEVMYGGTAMTRAKRSGLRRNALIAMVVSKDPQLTDTLSRIKDDPCPVLQETLQQLQSFDPG